jgi:anti-sigma B factor antagonist
MPHPTVSERAILRVHSVKHMRIPGVRLLEETQDGEICVLALAGQIDLHFAPALRELLKSKLSAKRKALVLDLSEVDFIDSTGIAALMEHLRATESYSDLFCIGGLSGRAKQILDIVCLKQVMLIFDTRPEALDAIRANCAPPLPKRLFGETE